MHVVKSCRGRGGGGVFGRVDTGIFTDNNSDIYNTVTLSQSVLRTRDPELRFRIQISDPIT
jgi:hypothetical protein